MNCGKLMLRQNWWKCMMLHQPLQCCHGSLLGTICSWIHSVFLVLSALWPARQEILSADAIHQTDPSQCVPQSWLRLGSSNQLITSYDDNRNLLKSTAPAQLQPISRLPKFQRQQEQHGRSDSYTPMCFINKKSLKVPAMENWNGAKAGNKWNQWMGLGKSHRWVNWQVMGKYGQCVRLITGQKPTPSTSKPLRQPWTHWTPTVWIKLCSIALYALYPICVSSTRKLAEKCVQSWSQSASFLSAKCAKPWLLTICRLAACAKLVQLNAMKYYTISDHDRSHEIPWSN